MIEITTKRLILREYKKSDWEAAHRYAQMEEILIYEAWGPNQEKDTQAFIARAIDERKQQARTTFELCVTLKNTGELIGGCGFGIDKDHPSRGNFGYIIHPERWNNGYATEAASGIIDYMEKNHGIKEVEATCDVLNLASQKVIQKCGLEKIKEIKDDFEMKGRMRSTFVFGKRYKR
jgi:ribosomal-protein-alanine N-acetyltransferase